VNDVTISGVAEDSPTDPVERVARPADTYGERPRRDSGAKIRRLPSKHEGSAEEESAAEPQADHELDSLA